MLKRVAVIIGSLLVLGLLVVSFRWATLTQTGNLSDPNKTIEVATGKTFELKLESDPKSGYRWDLAKPLDEKVVSLVTFAYDAPGPLVGANAHGKEEWEFKGMGAGQTTITLKYARPGQTEAAQTASFNVTVK